MRITKKQAIQYLLRYHHLLPPRTLDAAALPALVRQLGCLQFDPLDIVGRNPDLVLQSRIKAYTPQLLADALYKDRTLVDCWDKNQSIIPVEDWPYFGWRREKARTWPRAVEAGLPELAAPVLAQIRARGAVCGRDLQDQEGHFDWVWGARASKAAVVLDYLSGTGDLLVHHRARALRYYDLSERLLPAELLTKPGHETAEDRADWLVLRRIRSVGLLWNRGSDAYLGTDLRTAERSAAFARLEAAGRITPITVEDIPHALYIETAHLSELTAPPWEGRPDAALLAPLDNLMWDRALIEALFGFHYRWEVYTPVAQRQYGHYTLPILIGDELAARCEPVRDQTGLLVRNIWWEQKPTAAKRKALDRALDAFSKYLGLSGFVVAEQTHPAAGSARKKETEARTAAGNVRKKETGTRSATESDRKQEPEPHSPKGSARRKEIDAIPK